MENDKSINTNVDNRPIRSSPPIAPRISGITNNPARANQSVNATLPVESSSLQSNDQENIYVPHIILEPKSNPSDIVEQKSDVDITPEISHGVPSVELEPASGLKTNVSMVDVRPAAKISTVGYESSTETLPVSYDFKTDIVESKKDVKISKEKNKSHKVLLLVEIIASVLSVGLLILSVIWILSNI